MKRLVKKSTFIFVLFIIYLLGSFGLFSQTPIYIWAKNVGGSGGYTRGDDITVDAVGNTYVVGFFSDTVDVDPGLGVVNLIGGPEYNIFFAKYDINGNYIWAKKIVGTAYLLYGTPSIAVDVSGNVYLSGNYTGTVDFDPGAGLANLIGSNIDDVFFAKYDTNGNYVWAKKIGGIDFDQSQKIFIDNSNIYLTGYFRDTVDFNPGPGIDNLTGNSTDDIFFAKYDLNGNYVWAKAIGSTGQDVGFGITTDNVGNVYLTGDFSETVDFDPGPGISNLSAAGIWNDIFFAKYDSNGNYIWAKALIGASAPDVGKNICVDGNGNIYITGSFQVTVDFDPDNGISNLTATTYRDVFFAKYDMNGAYVWAKKIAGTSDDDAADITIDNNNDIYITGFFGGTADFDPGTGVYNLITNSSNPFHIDVFFAKYDMNGNYIWAEKIGTPGSNDIGSALFIDNNGYLYLTGYFTGTCNFDFNNSSANIIPSGYRDAFFAKYCVVNSCILGINDQTSRKKSVSVYPNPTTNFINVELESMSGEQTQIKIINTLGRVVMENFKSEISNQKSQILNIEHLPNGLYFVILEQDNVQTVIKVVKQ